MRCPEEGVLARARSDKGALIGQRCKGRDRSLVDGNPAKGAGLALLRQPCPVAKRGRLPPELGAGVISIAKKPPVIVGWAGVTESAEYGLDA